ncbi:MAG: glycosyltransferase [Patescibacteria group bacterium]
MKIVHFSTFDIEGGAGGAAYQLHKSFSQEGLDSLMLVKYKKSKDDSVVMIGNSIFKSKLWQKIKRNKFTYFIFNKFFVLSKKLNKENVFIKFNKNKSPILIKQISEYLKEVDIICLHWIDDFLSTEIIRKIQEVSKAPIIWILQDIEPLTGGCHYTNGCEKFKHSCGNCPQLKTNTENDLSRIIWKQKEKNLGLLNITFIAPSSWVYKRIKESSLFKNNPIEKILLSVDTEVFKKEDKIIIRKKLNLPIDKIIIFFGAQNFNEKRKGMDLFLKSLNQLRIKIIEKNPDFLESILLVSAGRDIENLDKYFKHKHLGWLNTPSELANIFQAADVFVCPSIEDAGPVMINQSITCATPVVSFNIGVASDLITSPDRGYIVKNYDTQEFCDSIYKVIFNENQSTIDRRCLECHPNTVINKYKKLFKKYE